MNTLEDERLEKRRRWGWSVWGGLGIVVLLIVLSIFWHSVFGTAARSDKHANSSSSGGESAEGVDVRNTLLRNAIFILGNYEQFDQDVAMDQVVDRLNQWVRPQEEKEAKDAKEGKEAKVDWDADPMIDTLPKPLLAGAWLEQIKDQTYDRSLDGPFLKETAWMRDISESVCREKRDDLAMAEQLFDWTIRNIQLLPDMHTKPGQINLAAELVARHLPADVLLYGLGTAQQRAWVFILLARQQKLDVVMLATPDPDHPGRLRPWLPALLHDGNLYLFDTNLGLPIPGPGGKGIATLAQAVDDPKVLDHMDLDEHHHYPIKSAEAKQASALLEASAGYLTRRMKLLEGQLAGTERAVLTTAPSQVAKRLKGVKYLSPKVELWTLPFETLALQPTREDADAVKTTKQALERKQIEEAQRWEIAPFKLLGPHVSAVVPGEQLKVLTDQLHEGELQHRDRVGITAQIDSAKGNQAVVTAIGPETSADKAGLQVGDRIRSVNGKKFTTEKEFQDLLLNEPDAELDLALQDGDHVRHVTVLRAKSEWVVESHKPAPRPAKIIFPLWAGRLLEFRGKYGGEMGAKHYYIMSRPDDEQLVDQVQELAADFSAGGPARVPPFEQIRNAVLRRKQDATYWLGLMSFDEAARQNPPNQDYSAAEDYFRKFTLEIWPTGPWTDGARYNLGRTYEASGRAADAIRVYEEDESAQRYGNHLRAAWLKEKNKAH